MKKHLILLLIPLLIACQKDQFGQVVGVDFKTSALCETDTQNVQFTNARTTPILIEGASISAGTNPVGNFSLISVTVDGQVFTSSGGGTIANVTIPAGSTYTFQMRYTPKTNYTTEAILEHEAVLDVSLSREAGAIHSPVGVQQIQLSGTVEQQATIEGCTNFSEGEEVFFDGEVQLEITHILAVTSKLSEPLNSDDGIEDFDPEPLRLVLNRAGGEASFDRIEAGALVLPRPREDVPTLGGLVTLDTVITTSQVFTGEYDSSRGSLILPDLEITLDGDFNTTVIVTLMTEEVSLSSLSVPLHRQAVPALGDHYDLLGNRIFGSRIDVEGNLVLVGTTTITDFTLDPVALGSSLDVLGGTTMAFLIEGKISTP